MRLTYLVTEQPVIPYSQQKHYCHSAFVLGTVDKYKPEALHGFHMSVV